VRAIPVSGMLDVEVVPNSERTLIGAFARPQHGRLVLALMAGSAGTTHRDV
jgi:hypothetical protein